jgi:hypothetical protein
MQIPPEIDAVIERLNEELNQVEQEATAGLNLTRTILEHFPNNATLIQFFAYLNSAVLLVEIDRKQIQTIVENFSETDVTTDEEIQETGEILAAELGRVLEAKIAVIEIRNRLENLQ